MKMNIWIKSFIKKMCCLLVLFFTIEKRLFLISLFQKLDPSSRGGPVRVALEVLYVSRGGPIP